MARDAAGHSPRRQMNPRPHPQLPPPILIGFGALLTEISVDYRLIRPIGCINNSHVPSTGSTVDFNRVLSDTGRLGVRTSGKVTSAHDTNTSVKDLAFHDQYGINRRHVRVHSFSPATGNNTNTNAIILPYSSFKLRHFVTTERLFSRTKYDSVCVWITCII